jgi:hypothetical protein
LLSISARSAASASAWAFAPAFPLETAPPIPPGAPSERDARGNYAFLQAALSAGGKSVAEGGMVIGVRSCEPESDGAGRL